MPNSKIAATLTTQLNLTLSGAGGAGNEFEQGAFARAVLADNAYRFAGAYGKAHIFKHPMLFTRTNEWRKPRSHTPQFTTPLTVRLAQILYMQFAAHS